MCSVRGIQTSLWMGCPIRILKVHSLYAAPLERFAGLRVLLRLQAPRHPPRTLCSLFSIHVSALVFCFSSVSTRADDFSAKLKEYPIRLVTCRVGYPNPWRVETSPVLTWLFCFGACPV